MKTLIKTGGTIVFILLLSVILLAGCSQNNNPDAIIILPGIMGSELFLESETVFEGKTFPADSKLWLDVDSVKQVIEVPGNIKMLTADNIGVYPSKPIINDCQSLSRYGALDTYSTLYKTIYSEFKDKCDVVFYSYDWRQDPYETAREFDAFLKEHKYKNVSIVAHSMGGLVASHYFAMGRSRRNKVCTYLSLGTPYLGSEQAAYAMITGNISGFFVNVFISDEARNICPNIDSMYALLPYEHLWRNYIGMYSFGGLSAAKSFSEEELLLSECVKNYSQDRHDRAKERKNILFTKKGKHISEFVNSYYLAGDGVDTIATINLPENPSFASKLTTVTKHPNGDGTVSLYSATAGGKLPAERTFIKKGGKDRLASHNSLADGSDTSTIDFILEVLQGEADNFSAFDLKSKYNIEKDLVSSY